MVSFTSGRAKEKMVREAVLSGCDEVETGDPRLMEILKKIGFFVAGVAFCIIVWWVFAEWYNANMARFISFPEPADCFGRAVEFFTEDFAILGSEVTVHLKYSLMRWMEGFLIAAFIGTAIGLAMGTNDSIYRFGSVPVGILQMIPGLAWYPVCILLFGLGEESALFIISITVISPIAINVSNGLRRVPEVNIRVARMCGKSRLDTFLEVLMPFAAMDVIAGFRIGMANAWRMLIAAEMVVGVAVGLGYAIQIETAYLDYTSAFACIILICAIGLVIDKFILASVENYASRKLGLGASR